MPSQRFGGLPESPAKLVGEVCTKPDYEDWRGGCVLINPSPRQEKKEERRKQRKKKREKKITQKKKISRNRS